MGANEKHEAAYHGVLSDDTVRGRYCDGTYAQTGHTTDGEDFDRWVETVRAEAVRETARYIERITPRGMVSRADILADLTVAELRISRGLHANGQERKP